MDDTKCGVALLPPAAPGPAYPWQTEALQRVLAQPMHRSAVADYLFLEAWEREPSDNAGVALRIGQIRRANPQLADEIRAQVKAELKRNRPGLRPAKPASPTR